MTLAASDDYVAFCDGVRSLTKVDLGQYKRGQMERRIRTFAGRFGHSSLVDYLGALKQDRDALDEFLDRMTINVSQLWRNPEQWELLLKTIVPAIATRGAVECWSAGSSYGAEAYTLAATCLEAAPRARARVLGTDIDPRVVERGRRGWFTQDDARTAPKRQLERWFEPSDGGWTAKAELKRLVRFEVGDLLRAHVPTNAFDLVLCRNVVIYFNDEARDGLHARLAASLRPGGYLMVGSTERIANPAGLGLAMAHPFTYRKA